ncbi:hypothetical protein [Brevibacillus brevis]|uniref:hypothetical protein n=1 Tax=Brevibacillus brevis TaxID=1393 RepID=UPI0012DC8334|nr:hypothetical protein [Brevibacillus brevis]
MNHIIEDKEPSLRILKQLGFINIEKAVVYVNDNSVKIGDRNSINQSQVNTGSQASLSGVWGHEDQDKIQQFIEAIRSNSSLKPEDAADAIDTITDLKEKKEGDTLRPSYLKRMWDSLPEGVKLLNGAMDIFKRFGGEA